MLLLPDICLGQICSENLLSSCMVSVSMFHADVRVGSSWSVLPFRSWEGARSSWPHTP